MIECYPAPNVSVCLFLQQSNTHVVKKLLEYSGGCLISFFCNTSFVLVNLRNAPPKHNSGIM